MNSAPAELLHPLIDAALQPLLAKVFSPTPDWEEGIRITCRLRSLAKKTLAAMPASEFCYNGQFFPKKTPPNPTESG
jgi:hypothetical protein